MINSQPFSPIFLSGDIKGSSRFISEKIVQIGVYDKFMGKYFKLRFVAPKNPPSD